MRYTRKTNANLLAFLCYRWWCLSWSMQILDEPKSNDKDFFSQQINEKSFKQQVKKLTDYEIITPAVYNAGDLDGVTRSSTIYQIGAFGKTYDIMLPKRNQTSYNTYVEYFGKNSSYEASYMREDECFYSGIVTGSDSSKTLDVVLNYCNGIEGMIVDSNNSLIFIEPIRTSNPLKRSLSQKHVVYKGDDVRLEASSDFQREEILYTPKFYSNASSKYRQRRNIKVSTPYQSYLTFINKSGRTVQLYYLDPFEAPIPFIAFAVHEKRSVNTYLGTTWIAKDDKSGQEFLLNGKTQFIAEKSSDSKRTTVVMTKPDNFRDLNNINGGGQLTNSVGGDHYYIEVLVVADDSVIKFHGKDRIEKYILTMMDIASRVFKHRSLGLVIHFQVVRIVLIEDNESGFTVYKKNPTKTLKSACNFITSLQNPDETDRDHFDFGIALTRKDFGPSGYAQLYSMCSRSRSCALVQDEGLTSAFIVAHETGHLLGLEHDGEGEASRCTHEGPRGSIMAPVIVARYDRYRWSQCSREVLKENIEYFQCLTNTPRQRFKPSLRNHGALYSLTEQCQFNFDKDYTTCTSFPINPCIRLWCSKNNSNSYCKTMRGPALEGTICNPNMHCSKGECKEYDNRIRAKDLGIIERQTIHGGWSSWSNWSKCSRTCRIGIRTRRRRCDEPIPTSDGRPCEGKRIEREVCNTKDCKIDSFHTRQMKHCEMAYGDDWTVYTDKDFTARLQKKDSHVNCTFENGLCNWENDKDNNINWEINKGATQSFNTGPSIDNTHKNAKGKYIYVEASATRHHSKKKGDIARLISKAITVPRVCFTMHYHMFGRDMGTLRIKIRYKNNSEHILWTQSGNKGDMWSNTQVNFESVGGYKIVIEAIRGQHWASDIAIDDISALSGFCSSETRSMYECKVSCRTKDFGVFKMNANITDGESCGGKRSSNICLGGDCITFGCDNKFASTLRTDDCGVCGGNSSQCRKESHTNEILPAKDYEILLELERGATFIEVLLHYPEVKYYYGLRTIRDNSLKMVMNTEAYVDLASTAFYFTKVDNKQRIASDGPLSEKVDIIIYTYQQYRQRKKKVYLDYQYFKPTPTKFTYQYKTVGWEECSKSCGTGQQKSAVSCIRIQDKLPVDKSFCEGLEIPLYIRACHLNPCPLTYKWLTSDWASCSTTCGGGVRVRGIVCHHLKSNVVVEGNLCPLVRPNTKETCNTKSCPKWHTSQWATCARSCGSGTQTRVVKCIDQSTGNALDDAKCTRRDRPETKAPCNIQPCETYFYIIQSIGKTCSKSCGGGFKIQIVNCVKNSTREPVQSIFCDGPSPPRLAVCNQHKCPEFVWKVRSSSCSRTCGNGSITREIFCVNLENDEKGDENNCRARKPASVVSCDNGKCPVYKWKVYEESPCSRTCGDGSTTRKLSCVNQDNGQIVEEQKCLDEKPSIEVVCNIQKCPSYRWKIIDTASCSHTCGNGTLTRNVFCVNPESNQRVDEKLCKENKPASSIICNQAKCLLYKWKVHETSPCSSTCGNGSVIREIVCANSETNRIVDSLKCRDEKKLEEIVTCFTTKCVNYEVRYSPWGRCSASCGTGVKRRTFTCFESFSRQLVSNKLCAHARIKLERSCRSRSSCREGDKLYCDFDKNTYCDWQNSQDDDFNWSIGKKTPSLYTGPEHDHTTKEGYFAYIEASLPRRRSEQARLYSPTIKAPKGCFVFWYHMRGEGDMGRLRVLLSSEKSKQVVFERKGHQGEYWLQAKVYIKSKSRTYKLIIEATRGSGVYSDVAIDDISFQSKNCDQITSKKPQYFLLKENRNCREISPYCKHRNRAVYCRGSPAYRKLCCRTCPIIINKKPNITVIEFTKNKN